MAQGRVTDFFSKRKANSGSLQPSKRQKIELSTVDVTNTNPYRNIGSETEALVENAAIDERKENSAFSPIQTRAGRKSKTSKSLALKASTRTRRTKVDPKQKLIAEVLSTSKQASEETSTDLVQDVANPSTPTKLHAPTVEKKTARRTKRGKVEEGLMVKDDATPEKVAPVPTPTVAESKSKTKKKLQMTENITNDSMDLLIPKAPKPVSPLHPTPEHLKNAEKLNAKMSANVAAALEKCKTLTKKGTKAKVSAEAMKEKLVKIDNLDDLKNRLSSMKQVREKVKTPAPALKKFDEIKVQVEVPREAEKKVPAYERFHHLATPAAPTLTLPYKYRLLAEHFRGMDQVVSMLHNRNEVCTFSKLKVAVQQFTKRNFEKSHVAQVKTVIPTAYELRQEKGLRNSQGFRENIYQLTVEARLEEEKGTKGRPTFKPSDLLSRRTMFHNGLIHIVKQHHKKFLSTLSRPLTVPDDKITRWHPKFPLDEVADVVEAELPLPPDVQLYQTARDVLENTRGKVAPKVEKALEETANEAEKMKPKVPEAPVPSASSSAPVSAALKGLPASLLEKIRAKEAAQAAASLTRNPKEDKRQIMLKRLPDLMRIIRSYFVTEKKPSLPLDTIIQKVTDSYRSCIAPGDVEPHINLCLELAPEWISIIKIQKGKYVKIDKNIDLQTLTDKVNNVLKGKK